MHVFDEYKPSSRHFRPHYRKTRLLGLVPTALALLLLRTHGADAGPGLWSAVGLAFALQMILAGVHGAMRHPEEQSRLTARWVADPDLWFPSFLVVMQTSFAALTVLIFWFTICELGFNVTWMEHLLVLFMVLLAPFRRIGRGLMLQDPTPVRVQRMKLLNCANVALATLFVARLLTIHMLPSELRSTSDAPPGMIIIWVPASVIIIISIAVFVGHTIRTRPHARPDEAVKETFDQTPGAGHY